MLSLFELNLQKRKGMGCLPFIHFYEIMEWKKIKAVLIDHLLKKSRSVICVEVPFLGGKRWADIVELKENSLIAYEIKSELDSFTKLKEQLYDYVNTFNEVYVILSKKFIGKHKDLPKSVGYFWVDPNEGITYIEEKS